MIRGSMILGTTSRPSGRSLSVAIAIVGLVLGLVGVGAGPARASDPHDGPHDGMHDVDPDGDHDHTTQEPLPGHGATMVRLQGRDRYDTAASISRHAFPDGALVAVLVTGEGYADALAAGPAARRWGGPVLLTRRDELPLASRDELVRLAPRHVVIVGGVHAVGATVATAVRELIGDVRRVGGEDRYETAALLASQFAPGDGGGTIVVATGEDFPDALAGGAAAARLGAPVLLVRHGHVPDVVVEQLRRLAPRHVDVLGGTQAVHDAVLDQLRGELDTTGQLHRLGGRDRFATAVEVSDHVFASAAGVAVVASATRFPDAMAASALGLPVLLAAHDAVTTDVHAAVDHHGTSEVLVLGGPDALSDAVTDDLAGHHHG